MVAWKVAISRGRIPSIYTSGKLSLQKNQIKPIDWVPQKCYPIHNKECVIIGKKFGMWTILNDSGKRGNDRGIIWSCICECGKKRDVRMKLLKNESKPRSCGCSRKIGAKKKFYSQIDKTGDCWEWKGSLNAGGYGKFANTTASRAVWKYEYGNIPISMQVCHTCDNRKCCNPKHLFLGTITENMKDKNAKNRQAKGSKIGSSILDEEKVLNIRKMR